MPTVHRRFHRFSCLFLLTLLLCRGLAPAWAAAPDAMAKARAVYTEVSQSETKMTTQQFFARVGNAAYTSAVVAKLDEGKVRKLAVTDLDDSGNVLTDLYFAADGMMVFAFRTFQGYKPNGQVETRNENRLYFQHGRLEHMLAGLTKTVLSPSDAMAQAESAAALAMARTLTTAALAPAAPTVVVGTRRKLAIGTVISVEPGDTACYLELTDAAGRVHREMADFALCEKPDSLIGKTVTLAYKLSTVMAAACQGNPACTQTDMVVLVTRATALAESNIPKAPPSSRKPSWCNQGETVVFSCHPGKKRVSVCASADASAKRGSLLYRFGSATGSTPDLSLPTTAPPPAGSATGEATGFAGGGGVWLRFTHGNYAYVVYSGIGRWGRNGATEERDGVQVERNGKLLANLPCTDPDVNELSPDWFQKMGIHPDAQGFEFPDTGN